MLCGNGLAFFFLSSNDKLLRKMCVLIIDIETEKNVSINYRVNGKSRLIASERAKTFNDECLFFCDFYLVAMWGCDWFFEGIFVLFEKCLIFCSYI